MTRSFFFYGMYEGNDEDPTWKVLHEHFEKLAREDTDDGATGASLEEELARADDDGMPPKQ